MTDNTAGPHLARIRFTSLLFYPPLVFDCSSSDSRSFTKVLTSVSILTSHSRLFFFFFPPPPLLLVGTCVGVHQSRTLGPHPQRDPEATDITDLPITLVPIWYLQGLWEPQTGNVYMDFACLFGSRFLSLYNPLVVHFSTPTLLFFFAACFAISRCSVDRRVLPRFSPIITFGFPIILHQHLQLVPIPQCPIIRPVLFSSYSIIQPTSVLLFLLPYFTFYFIFTTEIVSSRTSFPIGVAYVV